MKAGQGEDRPSLLAGLIGRGIQGSRTPAMHEREGAAQGLRYVYRRIDLEPLALGPDALPDLLLSAERMGFDGLNITFPCKQAVIPLLHGLSDDARALGAVNTVVLHGGRRVGHNTDGYGFTENFRRGLGDVRRDRVVQMGAGGGGAAVAHALAGFGVGRRAIFDTDHRRAAAPARPLGRRHRLRPARDRAAAASSRHRLPHARRRRHGGVPGCRSLPPVHRPGTGRGADAPAFRFDGCRADGELGWPERPTPEAQP